MKMTFKNISIALTSSWLLLFALLPLLFIIGMSFLSHDNYYFFRWHFTLHNYFELFDPLYLKVLSRSVLLATTCTVICLIIGYPFAYFLSSMHEKIKHYLILLLIIPLWTSSLIRSYAIMALIKNKGLINTVLLKLGIIHHPLQLLFTNTAVIIALVYNLLPFMILPLFNSLDRIDKSLIEAAEDLGGKKSIIFTRIIIPISKPGIIAGSILVFLPALTLFYIPNLLGGANSLLLGNVIENAFISTGNWPLGSAISMLLTGTLLILFIINSVNRSKQNPTP